MLRYINRFECPTEGFLVEAVFNASEFLPARLMQAGAPFFTRLEMPQEPGYRLTLTMGTVESSNPDQVAVLLDLATLVTETSVLAEPVLASTLDKAHDQIEQVFESCLTDAWRERFDQEV